MLIKGIEWQGVAVPFRRPFLTSSSSIQTRYSLVVRLETDTGIFGLGEAPASFIRSPASLRYAATALETIAPALLTRPLASAPFSAIPPPSLAFALETAAFDCLAQSEGKSLAVFLGGSSRPVEVNAIIGQTDPADTEALATKAVQEGFRTLKFKVGGRDMSIDEDALARTRNGVGNAIKLRLDANRAWPENQAALALDSLAKFSPEFIEEPVTPADISTLSRLRRNSPIPIAADESVENSDAATALTDSGAVDILVIKLARVGGLTVARTIFEHTRSAGIGVVLTSSLETGIGLASALHLAAALDIPHACGLATSPLLTHDLLEEPLSPTHGFLITPNFPGLGISIDSSAIQRYALGPRGQARL